MLSLEQVQANFIAIINDGPAALDDGLFTGPIDRIQLGLKAHANTINHARLVALEECFPLTRKHLGHAGFNRLSHDFAETPTARANDNNALGRNFAAFLALRRCDVSAVELARIEWAWLESYHASDAEPLTLSDVASLDEARLLELNLILHPATRLLQITVPLSAELADVAALNPTPTAVLITRPEATVTLLPLDRLTASIAAICEKPASVGNLLAATIEQASDTDPSGPVMTLIGAGALVAIG